MKSRLQLGLWLAVVCGPVSCNVLAQPAIPVARETLHARGDVPEFISQFCVDCHNAFDKTAGLDLENAKLKDLPEQSAVWESVVRKLRARQMPPPEMPRPTQANYASVLAALENALDKQAAAHPRPGQTNAMRRLTRTEYRNAIRDLLALKIDVGTLLPKDESSHGFDNVTVGDLSPTLLNRYIAAAQKISRLAVGGTSRSPGGATFRLPADLTQEEHVAGLPIGTRGGTLIAYNFPQDGQYDVQIRLARDRNEEVEGLRESHTLEVLLDRKRMMSFTVHPPKDHDHSLVDAGLKTRIPVTAGPHKLGLTFLKNPSSLLETKRQPYHAHFNMHRHPRISPAVYQVSITGPYLAKGPGDTPSRRRIFLCEPANPEDEERCARRILTTLMRRAYRRPVTVRDLDKAMQFYRKARAAGDFDAGIQAALSSILVRPDFLFRIEREPADVAAGSAYRVSDLELASRLSFFLWSSIPDDELLEVAIRGGLSDADELEQQVRRMLQDHRSRNLVSNFAEQWLYLRNLEAITPDLRRFPDFDDNLRQALRQETERFVEHILREDRSVLELIGADYTFLNGRLAKHYGIPHIYGNRFRRVTLDPESKRGGLLRHGSILTVTSYATRTSPVIRGKWILENLIGTPPPPPPANVPALKENRVDASLSVRERLAEHRANPACASCHKLMDPVGFSLENYDAVGRWRMKESGKPIDASGGLPDGSEFTGVKGLEQALLSRPELFVGTLTEKLLTFALGRGVEYYDAPAIRKILREAKAADYRFSSLVLGIVESTPFQMRTASNNRGSLPSPSP